MYILSVLLFFFSILIPTLSSTLPASSHTQTLPVSSHTPPTTTTTTTIASHASSTSLPISNPQASTLMHPQVVVSDQPSNSSQMTIPQVAPEQALINTENRISEYCNQHCKGLKEGCICAFECGVWCCYVMPFQVCLSSCKESCVDCYEGTLKGTLKAVNTSRGHDHFGNNVPQGCITDNRLNRNPLSLPYFPAPPPNPNPPPAH